MCDSVQYVLFHGNLVLLGDHQQAEQLCQQQLDERG